MPAILCFPTNRRKCFCCAELDFARHFSVLGFRRIPIGSLSHPCIGHISLGKRIYQTPGQIIKAGRKIAGCAIRMGLARFGVCFFDTEFDTLPPPHTGIYIRGEIGRTPPDASALHRFVMPNSLANWHHPFAEIYVDPNGGLRPIGSPDARYDLLGKQ